VIARALAERARRYSRDPLRKVPYGVAMAESQGGNTKRGLGSLLKPALALVRRRERRERREGGESQGGNTKRGLGSLLKPALALACPGCAQLIHANQQWRWRGVCGEDSGEDCRPPHAGAGTVT
jgi:hypothetical protein